MPSNPFSRKSWAAVVIIFSLFSTACSLLQHLNAHATSTQVGDKGELAAIKGIFGHGGFGEYSGLAVTSTKSATGHLLGAAGGIEAIFTALALRDQIIPPTLNLENPDEAAAGVDIVTGSARPAKIEHALSNGFGFGGVNASILLKRWQE
jgi:3-oxoacyl-[acyl-carrier-protein] synthase II